jgi:putative membrane protein
MSLKSRRILVISVDKDNDIGRATGVASPIIGRENITSVATLFAIRAPEDSDVNSLFASITTYDSLVEQGFTCQVAAIAGAEAGGFEADMKIASDLDRVLNSFTADGVIFVSDGAADEEVIPAIQAKVPVISVRKVFVQQQKSVEETYVLFYRYFKKLAEPQYSKLALGVPGIALLALAVLYLFNLINYAMISLGIIAGIVLILKGFRVDSFLKSEWAESPIKLIATVISLMIVAVACYRGIQIPLSESIYPQQTAAFVNSFLVNTVDFMTIGIGVYIGGKIVVKYLDETPKIWHEAVGLVALFFIRQMIIDATPIIIAPQSSILPFLFTAGIGAFICAMLVVLFTVTPRVRKRTSTHI